MNPTPEEIQLASDYADSTPETLLLQAEPTPIRAEDKLLESPVSPVVAVEFTPSAGSYNASVTVRLRCNQKHDCLRWALDRENVTQDDALYNPDEPLFLKQTASIAARAWTDGEAGPLAQALFEIVQPGWRKIEPLDQSDPTPHEISVQADLENGWMVAGASVRGKLHAHQGGWREDAFAHANAQASDTKYSILAVSDGAGSAPLSRVASNLICTSASCFLSERLATMTALSDDLATLTARDLPILREILVEAAQTALQALRDEAARRERPLKEFAATCLLCVRRPWNNQQLCAALQVGDGAIALWNGDQSLTLLGEADHGEQSGETRFLISSDIESELPSRVRFSIRPDLQAVAVMSDGVADDFFPEVQRLPEMFNAVLPVVSGEDAGASLLKWLSYEKKGSADDRALLVCWRDRSHQQTAGGGDSKL